MKKVSRFPFLKGFQGPKRVYEETCWSIESCSRAAASAVCFSRACFSTARNCCCCVSSWNLYSSASFCSETRAKSVKKNTSRNLVVFCIKLLCNKLYDDHVCVELRPTGSAIRSKGLQGIAWGIELMIVAQKMDIDIIRIPGAVY